MKLEKRINSLGPKIDEAVMQGKEELIDLFLSEKFRLMDRLMKIEEDSIGNQGALN